MIVCGVDPGPSESAYVLWTGERIISMANVPNGEFLLKLRDSTYRFDHLAIEQVRGFGIMASDGLFDTCEITGRYLEAFGEHRTTLIPRKMVSKHICGTSGISHDKFIREALITRFGPPGLKRAPGLLYGVAGHTWAALAVAVTCWDQHHALAAEPMAARTEGR